MPSSQPVLLKSVTPKRKYQREFDGFEQHDAPLNTDVLQENVGAKPKQVKDLINANKTSNARAKNNNTPRRRADAYRQNIDPHDTPIDVSRTRNLLGVLTGKAPAYVSPPVGTTTTFSTGTFFASALSKKVLIGVLAVVVVTGVVVPVVLLTGKGESSGLEEFETGNATTQQVSVDYTSAGDGNYSTWFPGTEGSSIDISSSESLSTTIPITEITTTTFSETTIQGWLSRMSYLDGWNCGARATTSGHFGTFSVKTDCLF